MNNLVSNVGILLFNEGIKYGLQLVTLLNMHKYLIGYDTRAVQYSLAR